MASVSMGRRAGWIATEKMSSGSICRWREREKKVGVSLRSCTLYVCMHARVCMYFCHVCMFVCMFV